MGLLQNEDPFSQLSQEEPRSIKEALSSPSWRRSMTDEFTALTNNKTWELVTFTSQQKIIDCKWVFKVKYKDDSYVLKHIARLVAKGFQQTEGVNYGETFSSVVKPTTIRVVLTIAPTFNWEVRQLDVNNTFLNGYLQETVFMHQPEGFIDSHKPHHVCKLTKALYGIKQAPQAWFDRLRFTLVQWGFENAKSDTSLFFRKTQSLTVSILVYVDDILVTGNDATYLKSFIQRLNVELALKDLRSLYYFLDLGVHKDRSAFHLSQVCHGYIEEI